MSHQFQKKLSLCMIVKNEEEMLEGCLTSIRDWVDEMIVVDTGSTDRSKEIAIACGAKVFDFEWISDFAAARNFAKEQCSSDYVIALDADERLNPADGQKLREDLDNRDASVIFVRLINARSRFDSVEDVVAGKVAAAPPVFLPRILKNTPENVWVGRIHESPNVDNSLQTIDIHLVHLGGDLEWRQAHNKSERNLKMLLAVLEEEPNQSALFWSYLSSEYHNAGMIDEFYEAVTQGWEKTKHVVEQKRISLAGNAIFYPLVMFVQGKYKEGIDALQFLIANLNHISVNAANTLHAAISTTIEVDFPPSIQKELYPIWLEVADMLLAMDGESFMEETLPGVTSFQAKNLKALALIKLHRFDEALEVIEEALTVKPRLDTSLLKIECYIEQGDMEKCAPLLLEVLSNNLHQGPDIWILGALVFIILGHHDDANDFISQAQLRSSIAFASRHRLALLRGLLVRKEVLAGRPVSGRGVYGVLGAILAREPLVSNTNVPEDILKNVVHQYLLLGQTDFIERFFDARAEHILPGVRERVIGYLTEFGLDVEDDGEQSLVILLGTGLKPLSKTFDQYDRYHLVEPDESEIAELLSAWDSYQDQQNDEMLFGGLDFWDDEEGNDDNDFTDWINAQLHKEKDKRNIIVLGDHPALLSAFQELYPRSLLIVHFEDPRQSIANLEISDDTKISEMINHWMSRLPDYHQIMRGDRSKVLYLNNNHIQKDAHALLSQLMAFIGEVEPQDLAENWSAFGRFEGPQIESEAFNSPEFLSVLKTWNIPNLEYSE